LRPLFFMTQYVYAISATKAPLTVKIGITKDWKSRQKQLKVGLQAKGEALIACHDMVAVERNLHDQFAEYRLPQSEWFVFPDKNFKENVLDLLKTFGSAVRIDSPVFDNKVAKKKKITIKDKFENPEHNKYHDFWEDFLNFAEDWHESFLDMSFENFWITQYCGAEWCENYWEVSLAYLTPSGSSEEFRLACFEPGKICLQVESYNLEDTWYRNNFGVNYIDIPLNDYDEYIIKYICKPLRFLSDLPPDEWPVEVKASQLRLEQEKFLLKKNNYQLEEAYEKTVAALRASES